jgi:hypothetical protein
LNVLNSASILFHRSFKLVLSGAALASLVTGIYFTRGENSNVLAAPASASMDAVDQSALMTARRLASQAHAANEQEEAAEAVRVADHAVDQAFAAALREAAADAPQLKGEALTTSLKIAALEKTVEEEKQQVVSLNAARLKTASQRDVADLGERAQAQLELDTDKLNELHRELILLGSDKQVRIQRALDEHDALQEQPVIASTLENDLESSQNLVTLPGKIRAFFEMRTREKQLRRAGEAAATAAARMMRQKEASDTRIQDQQQLAAIYGSWADLTKAKRVMVQHGILLALAILVGIFLAVPFGVILIRRELAGRVIEGRRVGRYPVIAGVVVEVLALAIILVVFFGAPIQMSAALGL